MSGLFRWIENRTGIGAAIGTCYNLRLPGGPGCRYVLPGLIGFTFLLDLLSGLFVWLFYSPGSVSSWESVYWLQEHIWGGWLVRGIHFYAANALVVLLLLYVAQLVFFGQYRAPREFVFWATLGMLGAALGLMLTGDLLRWDQEGFFSTTVRVSFLTLLDNVKPGLGGSLFKLVVGDSEFGNLTATRFLVLHVGVCTGGFLVLWLLHGWFLRRPAAAAEPECSGPYWPGQALRDTFAWLVLAAALGALIAWPAADPANAERAPGSYLGAHLGAPPDKSEGYAAARPEWAFLALYEFANMFQGEQKLIPIFIVPSILVALFCLMPFIGYFRIGHVFNVVLLAALFAAAGWLSWKCLEHDWQNADHQKALAAGHDAAVRVKQLATVQGIPVTGAVTLLREDPKTQGPKLFKQHCASCHHWSGGTDKDIRCEEIKDGKAIDKSSAPNLFHFADRAWIAGLMDPKRIGGPDYFGNTKNFRKGEMVSFVKDTFADLNDEEKKQMATAVWALSAEAGLKSQREADAKDAAQIKAGRALLVDDYGCTDCHKFHDKGKLGGAPDLTGYGSRQWLIGIISNPAHKRFYGERNERMPAYAEFPDEPTKNLLSPKAIEILTDWLRGEWFGD